MYQNNLEKNNLTVILCSLYLSESKKKNFIKFFLARNNHLIPV